MSTVDSTPELLVSDPGAWEQWLDRHHAKSSGVRLILAKRGSTTPTSLTHGQALEVALMFGWIDGQLGKRDDATWTVRFTLRRPRGPWSKRNVGIAERLIGEGRMRPAGLAEVERARADGRWDAAYHGSASISVPEDFAEALAAAPALPARRRGPKAAEHRPRAGELWRYWLRPGPDPAPEQNAEHRGVALVGRFLVRVGGTGWSSGGWVGTEARAVAWRGGVVSRDCGLVVTLRGRCVMDQSIFPVASSGATADANAVYSLGRNPVESARLRQQADELAGDSAALLERVDLQPGQRAIDLGCGPRGILDLLANRVSPGGQVVGLDADPLHTAMAADFVAENGLSGVEIVTADARRTDLPSGSFDVVHARTLLINVPDPEQVVAEMARLTRPGGWVASMEPDTEHVLCYPPHPAYERIREIFPVAFARNGADPRIGRRVPELLRGAGLEVVGLEARTQLYPPGNTRRTVTLDLVRSMRPHIVDLQLATESELEGWDAAARAHLENPNTVSMSGLFFLTWARQRM